MATKSVKVKQKISTTSSENNENPKRRKTVLFQQRHALYFAGSLDEGKKSRRENFRQEETTATDNANLPRIVYGLNGILSGVDNTNTETSGFHTETMQTTETEIQNFYWVENGHNS